MLMPNVRRALSVCRSTAPPAPRRGGLGVKIFSSGAGVAGSRHGASRLGEGIRHVNGGGPLLYAAGVSPFLELPGQGGPLQDGAGVRRAMHALR